MGGFRRFDLAERDILQDAIALDFGSRPAPRVAGPVGSGQREIPELPECGELLKRRP